MCFALCADFPMSLASGTRRDLKMKGFVTHQINVWKRADKMVEFVPVDLESVVYVSYSMTL